MAKNFLSATQVASPKLEAGSYKDGEGLILDVTAKGKKSWFQRYRHDGNRFRKKLGQYPGMTLSDARAKRDQVNEWLDQGLDPEVQWRLEFEAANEIVNEDVMTFGRFAEAELPRLTDHLTSDKSRKQWFSTVRTYAKPIWEMPIGDVTDADVAACLADQWTSKHETMSKTRARLQKIFRAAKRKGYHSGDNPAALENVEDYFAKPSRDDLRVRHHPTHHYNDMPEFFSKLNAREAISARAFMFKILTAARTSEVREMTWDEVDLETGRWSIPGERMKAGRPHMVPLSKDALAILASIESNRHGYVFTSENRMYAMSNGAMLALIRRMGKDAINRAGERVTPHGCARSAFKDFCAEVTDYEDELSEVALAHVDTKVKQSYRRESSVEKRRAMMQEWADHLFGRREAKAPELVAA